MPKKLANKQIKKILESINNKRARIVIEHILKHGYITTEDLEKEYGYNHPPRAARDVREAGIPLETFKVKSKSNKSIAAYRFGDLSTIKSERIKGRTQFPKDFKSQLFHKSAGRCAICNGLYEERYLQVDHCVPYEIAGDVEGQPIDSFMLLCASCNRAKSWSCEHCENWQKHHDPNKCLNCYWGNPINYNHIALRDIRRLDVIWEEKEVKYFENLRRHAEKYKLALPEFVKDIIRKTLG